MMNIPRQRRTFLKLTGLAALSITGSSTACALDAHHTAKPSHTGPITVNHALGSTVIAQPPQKIICLSYTGQDDVLALGHTPLAITHWFDSPPYGIWPWEAESFTEQKPLILNLESGIPFAEIAKLQPDIIFATNAGLDQETYQALTSIAPTIAHSNTDAFFEPWKLQARTIAQALFQSEKMEKILHHIDQLFHDISKNYPQLNKKKIALLSGQLENNTAISITDWHTNFLASMGCLTPTLPTLLPLDQLPTLITRDIDGIIWLTKTSEERHTITTNPVITSLHSHNIFPSIELAAAILFASPLSYPIVAQQLPELLMKMLIEK